MSKDFEDIDDELVTIDINNLDNDEDIAEEDEIETADETVEETYTFTKKQCIIGIICAVVAVILIFLIGFAIGKPNQKHISKKQVSTVYIDGQTNYMLSINKDNLVIEATSEDEDSQEILEHLSLRGETTDSAIKYLLGAMYLDGQFAEENATALISVDSPEDKYSDVIFYAIGSYLDENDFDFGYILKNVSAEELATAAETYEITVGKMGFIQLIIDSSDELTGSDARSLSKKSITELAVIYSGDEADESEEDKDKEASTEEKKEDSKEESSEKEDSDKKSDEQSESSDDTKKEETSKNNIIVSIKDKASSAVSNVTTSAGEAIENAKDAATDAATSAVEDAVDNAKDKVADSIENAANDVVENVAPDYGADQGTIDEIKDAIKDFIDKLFK